MRQGRTLHVFRFMLIEIEVNAEHPHLPLNILHASCCNVLNKFLFASRIVLRGLLVDPFETSSHLFRQRIVAVARNPESQFCAHLLPEAVSGAAAAPLGAVGGAIASAARILVRVW